MRDALTQQTTTFAGEVVTSLRQRAYRADGAAERKPRSWARRQPRAAPPLNAGLASRVAAGAVDLLTVTAIFVTGSALVGLASSAVGGFRPHWLAVTIAAVSGLLLDVAYFAGFWSLAGQTPGMRLLRIRVAGPDGEAPGLGRALVRLVGTWLAIAPLCLGLLPILVDDRRRALQDFIAGTVVTHGDDSVSEEALAEPDAVPTVSQ